MSVIRILKSASLVVAITAGAACSKDSTGPHPNGTGVSFDTWPPAVNSSFCVQGNALVGQNISGNISTSDCDAAAIDASYAGYFEVWRIRVASSRMVSFDVNSAFDNTLSVWRVNSVSSTRVNVTLLAQNDDRSPSDMNALLSVQLEPNIDYVVAVGGYDYTERGNYTLQIR